jgi:Lrp/AsnC family transcriptional regulator for asnA, asnC and gidA
VAATRRRALAALSASSGHNGLRLTARVDAGRNGCALRTSRPVEQRDANRLGPVGRARLDRVDRAIIEALQRNGRESFRRIAAAAGVSEATIRARYARLCEMAMVQVTGVTNPLGLGFGAMAMVGVKTAGPPQDVATELAGWDEAGYVVITAGQFDVLVELVCEDHHHLLEMTNRIRLLPSVVSTESFMYLELRKQLYDWGAGVNGGVREEAGG